MYRGSPARDGLLRSRRAPSGAATARARPRATIPPRDRLAGLVNRGREDRLPAGRAVFDVRPRELAGLAGLRDLVDPVRPGLARAPERRRGWQVDGRELDRFETVEVDVDQAAR